MVQGTHLEELVQYSQNTLNFSTVDQLAVNTLRILSAEMVEKAKSGHPGMPMGFALTAHILWSRFLRFNPDNPFWQGRDRFVLSAGHGSALFYSLLHLTGYDLSLDDLKQFRQWGSRTPGHPEFGVTPGVETTTGPLGQGFANAVGMAVAQRYIREQLELHLPNDFDPLEHRIFVVVSDGDLQEGISAEAASFAGHQKLGSLIVLYDDNRITIDGSTELSWSEDVPARFRAYHWRVLSADGQDPVSIFNALQNAISQDDQPTLIVVKTIIGFGSPNKQNTSNCHGSPLGEEELTLTKKALKWEYAPFFVPSEVYALYTVVADRGRRMQTEWEERFTGWIMEKSEHAELWSQLILGELPRGWDVNLTCDPQGKAMATREASGIALNLIAPGLPALVGGCADLAASVKTTIKGASDFLPNNPEGRTIHFGVREHAMGGIANGMRLYAGLRPYVGTFLVFSDYMRPSIRLAAMMKLPVIYLFSHDSIGVGEDGPTHQPIEQIAALRAIPNLWVIRPADLAETMEAWRAAVMREDGPTAIITSRQTIPAIDRTIYSSAEGLHRGAYILADGISSMIESSPDVPSSGKQGSPDVPSSGEKNHPSHIPDLILIATGSEVTLALEVYAALSTEKSLLIRVVSMPCWELFALQDESYREYVLPKTCTKRLAIETGISQGWERWVGDQGKIQGKILSIESFGASASGKRLFEEFGFMVSKIAREIFSIL